MRRMNTTLTIDSAGGLFLPRELLEKARFQRGEKVEVDIAADRIVVTSAAEETQVRVVNRGRLLVVEGLPADVDVVAAIKADRNERDAGIARAALGQ